MSVSIASESTRAVTRPRDQWWSREIELAERLRCLRDRVRAEIGADIALPNVESDTPWKSADVIATLTHICIDRLRVTSSAETVGAQRLGDLILDLQQLAMDHYLHDTAMRGQRLSDCAAGLSRLRGMPSSAALMDSVCDELVQRCGFHRAVLSQVESQGWKPLVLIDRTESAAGSWFSDWINQTVPLTSATPEAEVRAARRPALIHDTAEAPVYRPLIVQAGQSRSYVVAPLVHGNDVIGFLHTDHYPHPRRVDDSDRDVLWAFSDGFSHIYERTVLLERMRAHRDSIRELFFGAVDRMDDLCESGLEVSRNADDGAGRHDGAGAADLTEREAEVFELMVTGASNQEIADKLVITEGTVKSHVKHILRKYGAVNRAQAIAWALRG